jgi:hypothetical protein
MQLKARTRRIRSKMIFGSSLLNNEVSTVIYEDFLPQALADGRYAALPEPFVIGTGLDQIQTGLDAQKRGVSAQKIVITVNPAGRRIPKYTRRRALLRITVGP